MFADVTFSTEAMVVVGGMLAALTAAFWKIFTMLMASKDEQLNAMKSQRDSYSEIAAESIGSMEAMLVNKNGKPKPPPVAAVVPEHNSPTTKKQQADADLQTMRARLVAVTLQLGLPAREAAPAADGDDDS